ncbi:MAG: cytochrome d ubiquinol oxidase subunit II [Chitinivibrionales bacterium]|nr:cytochrome d ubiquinol oxidase subunit II [Chitinivibrionales bacterium]
MDPSLLKNAAFFFLLLFLLIYSILDGFDLGIGMFIPFVKDTNEKRKAISLIAPFWDGNEVWLIIAAGFLFALFPAAFAGLLSAFYLPFVLTVMAYITRACSLEFSYHDSRRENLWLILFSIGSFCASFFGLFVLGYLVFGFPIGADRTFSVSFSDYLFSFPILFALTMIFQVIWHGVTYTLRKNPSAIIVNTAQKTWIYSIVSYVVFTPFWFYFIDSFRQKPLVWFCAATSLCALVAGRVLIKKQGYPFFLSCISTASLWIMITSLLYPNILSSRINPAWSISIANSAAPHSTLKLLVILAAVLVPLILVYTVYIYRLFIRPEISTTHGSNGAHR